MKLVEGILLLHQLQGQAAHSQEPVELAVVVGALTESLAPLAEARDVTISCDLEATVVDAIPTHAEALARNLLENAVKYSPASSVVRVSLKGQSLTITNALPEGIQFDNQNLSTPFYRTDASRSARTGGNGLGLAICRAIVKANGWKFEMQPDGATVQVVVVFRS